MSDGQNKHLVLCYGTLKMGFGNHYLLGDSTYLGPAETNATMYSMGGFPAIILGGDSTIKGEVYEVDDTTLRHLDSLEGYPGWYDREVVSTPYGPAYIYTMHSAVNRAVVPSGVWERAA